MHRDLPFAQRAGRCHGIPTAAFDAIGDEHGGPLTAEIAEVAYELVQGERQGCLAARPQATDRLADRLPVLFAEGHEQLRVRTVALVTRALVAVGS